jgi:ribonuclease R
MPKMNKLPKKSSKQQNSNSFNKKSLISEILSIFTKSPQKELNHKQVSSILSIKESHNRELVVKALNELVKIGNLKESSKGKYKLKSKSSHIIGHIDMSKTGKAFLISEEMSEDIFIPFTNLHSALNGDKVKVCLYALRKGGKMEGEVIEIIERASLKFVGIIEKTNSYAFLIPDSQKMPYDIFIPGDNLNNAKEGDKVIVEIVEWHKKNKNPTGKVIEILGRPGENDVEMHAILAEFGLPYKFPEEINKAAKKISDKITQYDFETREDFRDKTTFTIDPEDAKDFDDALSIEFLEDNTYIIGIHIADVTNYIKENSELDQEAFNRACSVYLVDRVVPMLPERISNYLCSLRPNEDKLCFSVIFKMNDKAQILDFRIVKTIINSDRRFTYEEAQEIIDSGEGEFVKEIQTFNNLAKILRKERFKKGAFNFEHSEVKFILGENAVPTGVYFKEMTDSNHLIEEFMLLANKKAAEIYGKIKAPKPMIYRVHAEPNMEKLINFSNFISRFGYTVNYNNKVSLSKSMNNIVKEVNGKSEQNIIENLAIRAMAKAVYTSKNIGHYGLAFDYYTHFTSPIRRYPDILAHRLLFDYLRNKKPDTEDLEQKAKHCSHQEQQANFAERASIKYKQVEFMQSKIGEVFHGVISGVTEWGIFVELNENACEGLVHIRTLTDDFYEFNAEEYSLIGNYNRKVYQLGDEIKVKLVNVNLQKKQIDFELDYSEIVN